MFNSSLSRIGRAVRHTGVEKRPNGARAPRVCANKKLALSTFRCILGMVGCVPAKAVMRNLSVNNSIPLRGSATMHAIRQIEFLGYVTVAMTNWTLVGSSA
jgi:hypothetical protein